MKKILIYGSLLCMLGTACGYYSFSGSTLPAHMKTIAIPMFDDRTSEFGVDQTLNDKLIEAFVKDNSLKIADPRNADSILEGTIRNVRYQAGAYNSNEQVEDIKVYITVDVKFTDVKQNTVVWEEQLTQWGTYNPNDADGQRAGLDDAIDNIVQDIVNKTIAGW
ncbi:LptE family protein [candidate division KSB1 bacterium]|nr:LptE family protein [candidate division KSB1 bacterium]